VEIAMELVMEEEPPAFSLSCSRPGGKTVDDSERKTCGVQRLDTCREYNNISWTGDPTQQELDFSDSATQLGEDAAKSSLAAFKRGFKPLHEKIRKLMYFS